MIRKIITTVDLAQEYLRVRVRESGVKHHNPNPQIVLFISLFKEQRIVDFDNLTEYKDTFKDLDTGFCCLGTTKGKSGKVGFITS